MFVPLEGGSSSALPASAASASTSAPRGERAFLRVFRSFPSRQEREGAQAPWVGEGVADVAVESACWVSSADEERWAGDGKQEFFDLAPGF